jgi:hypothetical protein
MIFIDTSGYDDRRPNPNGTNSFIYDLPMDWSKQVANGAQFAFIKCSEYLEDPGFEIQWTAARKTNLILGAWHYFHPSVNAIAQAQMQIGLLKKVGLNWSGNPHNSDKIQLDLENMDGLSPLKVVQAAASWYNEIRKVYPFYEIDIYTGWWFWSELLATGFNMDWAKDTEWWLPAYPLDPTPRTINPPPPFNAAQVADLASKAFTQYAMKDLFPWGQPSFRQITAWADSRDVPGHPAIKKVVDINAMNPNYFGNAPIPAPTPSPSPYPEYLTTCIVNVRSANYKPVSPEKDNVVGTLPKDTPVYVDTGFVPEGYSHIQPIAQFTNGGYIASSLLRKP